MKKRKGLRPQASGLRKKNKKAPARRANRSGGSKWLGFVKKHGVVLASAKGPVPSVAEAVAGEPIVGSWWAHPKGKQIFQALSQLDESQDVRCFRLVDGKITLVHRRVWPALVRLGNEGELSAERLAVLQQEHMPTGEHRNFVTPFPEWVDDATALAAKKLSRDEARVVLGPVAGAGQAGARRARGKKRS